MKQLEMYELQQTEEDAIVEAAIAPTLTRMLDDLSTGLAKRYAPIDVSDPGNVKYDLATGQATARRQLVEALISWIDTDPALDGDELAILKR